MGAKFIEDSTWYGVDDPKKRKKIQDRLAQRARRKKIALAKTRKEDFDSSSNSAMSLSSSETSDCSFSESRSTPSPRDVPSNGAAWVLVPIVERDDRVLSHIPSSVFAALYNNGAMLGLTCGCLVPAKSSPCASHIPEPLRPTALQLTTLHQTWIDRFPFPKMRDNMIRLNRIFNEEEFLRDLFNMHSFTIKDGGAFWNPGSWVIGKDFSQKWGYLFY